MKRNEEKIWRICATDRQATGGFAAAIRESGTTDDSTHYTTNCPQTDNNLFQCCRGFQTFSNRNICRITFTKCFQMALNSENAFYNTVLNFYGSCLLIKYKFQTPKGTMLPTLILLWQTKNRSINYTALEDGHSMFLQTAGTYIPICTSSYSKKQ